MTVRILIERTVETDMQGESLELLKQLRGKAILQPGYISGESLISVDKPGMHLVISTWHSLADWRAWENDPERLKIIAEIERLLTAPSKTSVFIEPWAKMPEAA